MDDITAVTDLPSPGLSGVSPSGPTDPLSGLATRQRLIDTMECLLADGDGTGQRPALILLDLDRFKTMNDRLGPLVCDRLLARVAQRLRTVVPEAELIARTSGDGFAILLRDGGAAHSVAGRLLDMLGRPYAVSGFAVTLGSSIGMALAGRDGDDAHRLLHAADLAMHRAEADGRNRVRSFEPAMQEHARRLQSLETDLRAAMAMQQAELRRALVSEQFEVHYQPQLAFADHRLTGFEALLRWRHPTRGMVPPSAFIPLAEEIGLIDLLGEWVIRTACRTAATWPLLPGGTPLRLAVNVSPLQLRDGRGLLAGIDRALLQSGFEPSRLEIELTEVAVADDPGETLKAIRRLGADLALDDFGTGYSSLSRLRQHPFTRVKIDRSFIAGVGEATYAEAEPGTDELMIRAIAAMSAGLGLGTVVEGIETPFQSEVARRAGCTEMQGYLLGRPMAAANVAPFVMQWACQRPSVLQPETH